VDNPQENIEKIFGVVLVAFGALLLIGGLVGVLRDVLSQEPSLSATAGTILTIFCFIGAALLVIGAVMALGRLPKKFSFGGEKGGSVEFSQSVRTEKYAMELKAEVKKKELSPEERKDGQSYAETKVLPDRDALVYSAIDQTGVNKLLVGPSAYPMTPMYLLDKDYRVLDWNEAFSLAFDRTMEGRQGKSVLEWTYHLDNFQEVLDHGEQTFADPERLPMHDTETIIYTSLRYGRMEALKHAYQIGGKDGRCAAWSISLDIDFHDPAEKSRYRYELLQLLGLDQLWSEYAINYDRVLVNTRVYRDLIDTLLGIKGSLKSIPNDARVLDLGAGSGNLTRRLMDGVSNRTVFALDNNRIMLEFLRDKCRDYLREDDLKPGVVVIKQDVTSLFGLDDDDFDCVIANNVFYALADPDACLEAVYRILRPGGELRMSGPRVDTDLEILFRRIRADLEEAGHFEECRLAYEHVEQINKQRLRTMLHRWSTDDFCALLKKNGFKVTHRSDDIYAGQSMLVTAEKPGNDTTSLSIHIPGKTN
jgi:ubiquinone/menaquinone biosynthesis C-methylase UbiE